MPTDDSPPADAGRPDYRRLSLALVCLLAAVVAAGALPALSPSGTASPAASLVPVPGESDVGDPGVTAGGSGAGSGQLGALSPTDRTGVGGSLTDGNGLRSRSAETHFTVRTTEPSYWRTAAYETYTGEGWERVDGDFDAPARNETEVVYRVRLNRSATGLPTAWRPAAVTGVDAARTDGDAMRVARGLPEGTTYDGVSHRPPRDADLLRSAGRAYPSEIERRYTQLPAREETSLGPTTEGVTADADTPYETARRIETWLERTKEYSLNASHPSDVGVASGFVHRMDRGYCEYFATAMVAMLRTQDVPSRYVVGYAPGERTGEDTYAVRGMHAHAWVEVYFPDVGWVRFDPTPAAERRAADESAYERQRDDEYGTDDAPDGGEEGTDEPTGPDGEATDDPASESDGGTEAPTDGSGTDDEARTAGEYDVALNRSAVPGAAVTVTVTDDGGPVSGATVLFDGDPVGTTDAAGNVTGRVPYTDELSVAVEAPNGGGAAAVGGGSPVAAPVDGGSPSLASTGGVPPPLASTDRQFAFAGPRVATGDRVAIATGAAQVAANATFEVETRATVSVVGDVRTGSEVTVVAAVDDAPVADATVALDGRPVAETDADGRASVTLPEEPGDVTVAVRRDPVAGNRTLSPSALNVSASPTTGLAMPGGDVVLTATVGGDPVPGAPVTLNGERVATTGVDGEATVTLPAANAATVTVVAGDRRATVELGGLYANLAIGLVLVAATIAGLATALRRRDVSAGDLTAWLRRASRVAATGLLALAAGLDALADRCRERALRTVDHLRALLAGRLSPADALAALRRWAATRSDELRARAADRPGDASRAAANDRSDAHATLRVAWARFLERCTLGRPRTHSPGEIAAHAVAVDGYPEEAVTTIVRGFRAVEYGDRDPGSVAPDVERAVDAVAAADPSPNGRAADDETDVARAEGDARDPDDASDGSGEVTGQ